MFTEFPFFCFAWNDIYAVSPGKTNDPPGQATILLLGYGRP